MLSGLFVRSSIATIRNDCWILVAIDNTFIFVTTGPASFDLLNFLHFACLCNVTRLDGSIDLLGLVL